jgi:hypothetical protein
MFLPLYFLSISDQSTTSKKLTLLAMPGKNPLLGFFPGAGKIGILAVLGFTSLKLCFLPSGQRKALGLDRNAVPEILDQLEPLGQRQLEKLARVLVHVRPVKN